MKIENQRNPYFKALYLGEFPKVVRISGEAGLSSATLQRLLSEVNKACPNRQDRAYFYFRKYLPGENSNTEPVVRSAVKLVSGSSVKELNIDPRNCHPKYLLQKMVTGIKKLITNQVKSDGTVVLYDYPQNSWLNFYSENSNKWFENFQSFLNKKK